MEKRGRKESDLTEVTDEKRNNVCRETVPGAMKMAPGTVIFLPHLGKSVGLEGFIRAIYTECIKNSKPKAETKQRNRYYTKKKEGEDKMVGIAVISHGKLCEGLLDSAGMIAGEFEQTKAVSLRPGMSPETYRAMVLEAVKELDTGEGVLVLADIPGGTPFNSIAILMKEIGKAVMVTGVNLPMLVTTVLERDDGVALEELAATARAAGTEGIRTFPDAEANNKNTEDEEDDDL